MQMSTWQQSSHATHLLQTCMCTSSLLVIDTLTLLNPMQVLLPALRSDMASLPLPSDRLQSANNAQATKQAENTKPSSQNPSAPLLTRQHCTKVFVQSMASIRAADPTVNLCSHPSRQGGSQQSSAGSSSFMLDAEAAESIAAESITASEAATVADDIPIQPLNKQRADGTCVAPSIGRRSTPFSTSDPSHLSSSNGGQHTSAVATEAFSQQDMPLQDDMTARRSVGDAKDSAEGRRQENLMLGQQVGQQVGQQEPSSSIPGECYGASAGCGEQPDGCQRRPYLTCCVRLSEEKDPHR